MKRWFPNAKVTALFSARGRATAVKQQRGAARESVRAAVVR